MFIAFIIAFLLVLGISYGYRTLDIKDRGFAWKCLAYGAVVAVIALALLVVIVYIF
jgi:hypothetical protein